MADRRFEGLNLPSAPEGSSDGRSPLFAPGGAVIGPFFPPPGCTVMADRDQKRVTCPVRADEDSARWVKCRC